MHLNEHRMGTRITNVGCKTYFPVTFGKIIKRQVQQYQNMFNIFILYGDINNILMGCFLFYTLLFFFFGISTIKPVYISEIIIITIQIKVLDTIIN